MPNKDRSLQSFQIQMERGLPGVFSSYPAVAQTLSATVSSSVASGAELGRHDTRERNIYVLSEGDMIWIFYRRRME